MKTNPQPESGADAADFAERVRFNQQKLRAELQPRYDFIVCGSGPCGRVEVASRAGMIRSPTASTIGRLGDVLMTILG